MLDRVPTPGQEGRVLIAPENGGAPFYATIQMADNPSVEGTPWAVSTVLQQAVSQLIGLGSDAVPNDMFNVLATVGDLQVWKRTVTSESGHYTLGPSQPLTIQYGVQSSSNYPTVYVSSSIAVSAATGEVTMNSPTLVSITAASQVQGKYIRDQFDGTGEEAFSGIWFVSPTADYTWSYATTPSLGYKGVISSAQLVTGYPSGAYVDYPVSVNPNAYQEGTSGTTSIEYMGQLGSKARIETGSYVGTGKYGSSNPNTLTFEFEPKLVIVTGRTNTTSDYQSMGIFVQGAQWTFGAGAGTALNTTVFSGNNGANQITWNGNTISWYTLCTATTGNYRPAAQLNSSGRTYYYIAIG